MWRRLVRREQGYALVTLALLLLTLAVLLALVVDVGYAYVQKQRMQAAADAAALAGTQVLQLEGAARAQEVAADYAHRNGATSVIVEVDPGAKKVRVTKAETSFSSFFPSVVESILGTDKYSVRNPAAAKAIRGPVAGMREGVYPIAVNWQDFQADGTTVYDIYVGVEPGNFGWLSWDGTMSEDYLASCLGDPTRSAEYINPDSGNNEALAIDKWVWGRPGVANSISVRDALDNLKGRPITIVVWKGTRNAGSDAQYLIAGFAKFILTDYRLPSRNRISGKFVKWVDPNALITLDYSADFGLHGIQLTE